MTTSTHDIKSNNNSANNYNKNDFVLRDYVYIAEREAQGDGFWKTYERWYYYSRKNENYVLPTFIFCVIAFFTNPIHIGIFGIVLLISGALFLCHCNNRELDLNPDIQRRRWEIRKNNEKFIAQHGRLY